jgi:hypothetical protein
MHCVLSDNAYNDGISSSSMAELRLSTAEEKLKMAKGVAEKKD